MAATLGFEGVDIQLPDNIDSDSVATVTGPNGEALVTVNKNVDEVEIDVTGDTTIQGSKFKDYELKVESNNNETINVVIENKLIEGTIEAKSPVNIQFTNKLKELVCNLSKKDDVITLGNNKTGKFKNIEIDLGKKGFDQVVVDGKKFKAVTIKNFNKNDEFVFKGKTYTLNDIKDGETFKGFDFN